MVPLAAVTFYSYTANVDALRDAAEREADLLAGELGQRMQLVTAQLTERVEHLMDIAELQAAAEQARECRARRPRRDRTGADARPCFGPAMNRTEASSAPSSSRNGADRSIAKSLGEAAMLLNNVELQNMRGFGRGTDGGSAGRARPPPPAGRGGRAASPSAPPRSAVRRRCESTAPTARGAATDRRPSVATAARRGDSAPCPVTATRASDQCGAATSGQRSGRPNRGWYGSASAAGRPRTRRRDRTRRAGHAAMPAIRRVTMVDANGKLMIDMGPIRREMFRQICRRPRSENLTPEERQRIAAEMNQRMLGIQQGIKIGAAELAEARAGSRESRRKDGAGAEGGGDGEAGNGHGEGRT